MKLPTWPPCPTMHWAFLNPIQIYKETKKQRKNINLKETQLLNRGILIFYYTMLHNILNLTVITASKQPHLNTCLNKQYVYQALFELHFKMCNCYGLFSFLMDLLCSFKRELLLYHTIDTEDFFWQRPSIIVAHFWKERSYKNKQ